MTFPGQKNAARPKGFTLVEVLLVVAMLSMISLAIYNAFSGGLKIWQRVQDFEQDQDAAIFLDRLEDELHNAFPFSTIAFIGRPDRLTFPTVVKTLADESATGGKTAYVSQVGQVQYTYDPYEKILYRQDANYSQAVRKEFAGRRAVLFPVTGVRFTYFTVSKKEGPREIDSIDELSSGVIVELDYADKRNKAQSIRRVINIPRGLKP